MRHKNLLILLLLLLLLSLLIILLLKTRESNIRKSRKNEKVAHKGDGVRAHFEENESDSRGWF